MSLPPVELTVDDLDVITRCGKVSEIHVRPTGMAKLALAGYTREMRIHLRGTDQGTVIVTEETES
jgi:hypothetical protein